MRCALELESILYRPPICRPDYYQQVEAKLTNQISTYLLANNNQLDLGFCVQVIYEYDFLVTIVDAFGTPVCYFFPGKNVGAVYPWDTLFYFFVTPYATPPVLQALYFNNVWSLAYNVVPGPPTVFDPYNPNALLGLYAIGYYFYSNEQNQPASIDIYAQILSQAYADITYSSDSIALYYQLDIDFWTRFSMIMEAVSLNSYYTAVYQPVLSWYNLSMTPSSNPDPDIAHSVDASTFLYLMTSMFNSAPYAADPELRKGQYDRILTFVFKPASLALSYAPPVPVLYHENKLCYYGFTYNKVDMPVYRIAIVDSYMQQ